jgi:pyruvate dehydrogenase E2 component (dihydrolipoamide acetyltransferase)
MAERIPMIALSPTMELGTVVTWRKKAGDVVKSGDVICEVETDKAVMDYESASDGTLLKILVPEGGQAKVGDPIAVIGKAGEDISSLTEIPPAPAAAAMPAQAAPPAAIPAAAPSAAVRAGRVRSSPLARKLAMERHIDLGGISGSGPGGRIIRRDLTPAASAPLTPAASAPLTPAASAPPPSAAAASREGSVLPLSGMRRTIAARLSQSMFSAPHYYLTVAVVMDALLAARAAVNEGGSRKLSFNAFLMKLAAEALKRHPRVNASWNEDSILLRSRADIGLAVALEDGLITPVVRDCGAKGIKAIDAELTDLVERARAGGLKPEEYSDAGFTISNLGRYGIEEFTAVINPPGSAILAVGAIAREPVAGPGDAVVVKSRMRATLSCDHRVIDGAVGAAFLDELRGMIENPFKALL